MAEARMSHSNSVTIDEVVTTVIMARVTDYFGFFVYAIASALVFPELFFPTFDPVSAIILSFGVFSLAFLARPVASLMARWVETKIGRAGKIILALMIFGSSTVAIGMLPGYDSIGWIAPALLIIFRILQGIGLGGGWDGFTLQLKSAAPKGREGLYGIVPQLGGPIGFCIAASLFFVLTGFLTEKEFIEWGWRFAFFGVMAVNVVSLFARLRLLSADFGATSGTIAKSAPFLDMLRTQWRPIMLSTLTPLASYALFNMVTVFPLGYTVVHEGQPISDVLLTQMAGGALAIFSVIGSGLLADRFGQRWVLWMSTGLITLLCPTIYWLDTHPVVYILFGFLLLGFAHGQASAIVADRFPPEYRYSGSALSNNLSWICGAAFAPLVGFVLAVEFGLWAAALYLLSGVLVTGLTLYILQSRKRA